MENGPKPLLLADKFKYSKIDKDVLLEKYFSLLKLEGDSQENIEKVIIYCIKNLEKFPSSIKTNKSCFEYVPKEWNIDSKKLKKKVVTVSTLSKLLGGFDRKNKIINFEIRKTERFLKFKNLLELLNKIFGYEITFTYVEGENDLDKELYFFTTQMLKFLRIYQVDEESYEKFEIPTTSFRLLNYIKYIHYKISNNEKFIISSKQIENFFVRNIELLHKETFTKFLYFITENIFENFKIQKMFMSECNKSTRYQMSVVEKIRFKDKNAKNTELIHCLYEESEIPMKFPFLDKCKNRVRTDEFFFNNSYEVLQREEISEKYMTIYRNNFFEYCNRDENLIKEIEERFNISQKIAKEKKFKSIHQVSPSDIKKEIIKNKKYYNITNDKFIKINKDISDIERYCFLPQFKIEDLETKINEFLSKYNDILYYDYCNKLIMSSKVIWEKLTIKQESKRFVFINKSYQVGKNDYILDFHLVFNEINKIDEECKFPLINFKTKLKPTFTLNYSNKKIIFDSYQDLIFKLTGIEYKEIEESYKQLCNFNFNNLFERINVIDKERKIKDVIIIEENKEFSEVEENLIIEFNATSIENKENFLMTHKGQMSEEFFLKLYKMFENDKIEESF